MGTERITLLASALLGALATAAAQHGNGMNSPGGLDLGALLGGGAGGANGQKAYCSKKGQVLVPKTDYLPAANGCGPTGMRQKNGDQWRLHECCNGHDTCYAACGVSHSFCEKEFKRCMYDMCDSVNGGAQCKETANSFAGMTSMFGKSFHENGMREACDCVSEEEAPARFEEYVKFMYEQYNKEKVPSVGDCKGKEKECTDEEKVRALVKKHSTAKDGKKKHPGKLFWKLVNTYKHISWVQDGEMGLTDEECEVAERDGKRFGEL